MVTIVKGSTEFTVSRGAFESFYRRCGFKLREAPDQAQVTELNVPQEKVHPEISVNLADESTLEDDPQEEVSEEPDDVSMDYSEIPLTELTFEQLSEYADELGLDHEGIKTAKGLRALIKANR